MTEKRKITRNRDTVTYLTPEEVKAYCKRQDLTGVEYAYQMGISVSTANYYSNGYAPVPYHIAKLMHFRETYDDVVTGPADTRLMHNTRFDLRKEPKMPYAVGIEIEMFLNAKEWTKAALADMLGYKSARPVENWLSDRSDIGYCEAKLMQYFLEMDDEAVFERIPRIDDVFDTVRPITPATPRRILPKKEGELDFFL